MSFVVLPINGMKTSISHIFSEFQDTVKNHYTFASLTACIGMPIILLLCYIKYKYGIEKKVTTEKNPAEKQAQEVPGTVVQLIQKFWLQTSDGVIHTISIQEAQKNEVLCFYIEKFSNPNSQENPLRIGDIACLSDLTWENFLVQHKKTRERLEYGIAISKNLPEELDHYIAEKMLCVGIGDLQFILDQIIDLRYMPKESRSEERQKFTYDKKFYYYKPNSLQDTVTFYNDKSEKIFSFINDEIVFKIAHKGNFIVYIYNDFHSKTKPKKLFIYDLVTQKEKKLSHVRFEHASGCSCFIISPNDQYVAYLKKQYANKYVRILDIKSGEVKKLNHEGATELVFSFDSQYLISYGTDKSTPTLPILWNLKNMGNIQGSKLSLIGGVERIIFNRDSAIICGIYSKYWPATYQLIDINNPQNVVDELKTDCVGYNRHIFPHETDFILCERREWQNKPFFRRLYKIFSKMGDPVYSYKPEIVYNDDKYWDFPRLDWFSLSSSFKDKIDTLSEIRKTITTSQLVILQNICKQKRKADEDFIFKKDGLESKIFDSFEEKNKKFLKENLLLTV